MLDLTWSGHAGLCAGLASRANGEPAGLASRGDLLRSGEDLGVAWRCRRLGKQVRGGTQGGAEWGNGVMDEWAHPWAAPGRVKMPAASACPSVRPS